MLLELIIVLNKRGCDVSNRKVTIAIDNSKMRNGVTNVTLKASTHSQDAGAEIAQIQRLLREIKFSIEFKLARIKKGTLSCFRVNPCDYLLKVCD